jgi:uncharacterized protein
VAQAGEQSVGDILESIRKVMERDDRAVGEPSPGPRQSDQTPAPIEPAADDDGPVPVLELTDAHLEQVAAPDAEPRQAPAPVPSPPAASAAPVAGEAARASLHNLLASLAALADPAPKPHGVPAGETSLEGLVRELLRPMLAEWLEKNLPPLAEKLAAAEIARIRDGLG